MPSDTLPLYLLPLHPLTGRRAVGWRRPRATRGEVGPQPVWPIAGGDGTGTGTDTGTGTGDDGGKDGAKNDGGTGDGDGDGDGTKDDGTKRDGQGDDAKLGEGGIKALEKERADRKAAEARATESEKKAAELEAENARLRRANASTKGHDLDAIKTELREELQAENAERLIRAEIKAAAANKLRKPEDALAFIKPSDFTLNADGDVETAAIDKAVEDLLKERPYLGADADKARGWGDIGAGRTPGGNGGGDDVRPGGDRIRAAYASGNTK